MNPFNPKYSEVSYAFRKKRHATATGEVGHA